VWEECAAPVMCSSHVFFWTTAAAHRLRNRCHSNWVKVKGGELFIHHRN
jgi:hypothetical protein